MTSGARGARHRGGVAASVRAGYRDAVVDRRDIGSWLSGPRSALEDQGYDFGYRGERLGLPETGQGSLAGFGRRLAAVVIDWFASILVVRLVFPELSPTSATIGSFDPSFSLAVLGVFAFEVTVLTWLLGASFGKTFLGIGVRRLDGAPAGLPRALLRTLLVCLVVPAVVWDRDGRGLHDRWCGTACLRTR